MIESRKTIERQHKRRERAAKDAWLEGERQAIQTYLAERIAEVAAREEEYKRRANLPWWKRAWLWINE